MPLAVIESVLPIVTATTTAAAFDNDGDSIHYDNT